MIFKLPIRSKKATFLVVFGILVLTVIFSVLLVLKLLEKSGQQDKAGKGQTTQTTPTPSPGVLGEATKTDQEKTPTQPAQTQQTPVSSPTSTPTSVQTQIAPAAPLVLPLPTQAPGQEPIVFNVIVQDTASGVNSDLDFHFSQETGPETLKGFVIKIPAGWIIIPSQATGEGEVVGNGNLAFVLDGVPGNVPVTIVNSQNTQGHQYYWKIHFGSIDSPSVTLDSFIDGNAGQGYTWTIDRKFLFDIKPPITFNLKILAKYTKKPENPGEFIFEQIANFVSGFSKTFQKATSIF